LNQIIYFSDFELSQLGMMFAIIYLLSSFSRNRRLLVFR